MAGLVIIPQKQNSPTLEYPEAHVEQFVKLEQTVHYLGQASQFPVILDPNNRLGHT